MEIDQEPSEAEAFVLTGGRSTRMGQDKALLQLAGRSLLELALDKLGTLRYGSPVMHVVGDRTTPHGLASVGYDEADIEKLLEARAVFEDLWVD